MDWRTELIDKFEDPDGSDVVTLDPHRVDKVRDILESFAVVLIAAVESDEDRAHLGRWVARVLDDPQARPWLDKVLAFELAGLRQDAGDDSAKLLKIAGIEREVRGIVSRQARNPQAM